MKEQPRGIKEHLDYCLEKYYRSLLEKYGFHLVDQQISGMGAYYSFKNDRLKLDIVNDRGIVETRIASIYSPDHFWDLDLLNVLIILKNEEKNIENFTFRTYLTKRLSLREESELLDSNMKFIREAFSKDNYLQTHKVLSDIGERRAEVLFGNKLKKK